MTFHLQVVALLYQKCEKKVNKGNKSDQQRRHVYVYWVKLEHKHRIVVNCRLTTMIWNFFSTSPDWLLAVNHPGNSNGIYCLEPINVGFLLIMNFIPPEDLYNSFLVDRILFNDTSFSFYRHIALSTSITTYTGRSHTHISNRTSIKAVLRRSYVLLP